MLPQQALEARHGLFTKLLRKYQRSYSREDSISGGVPDGGPSQKGLGQGGVGGLGPRPGSNLGGGGEEVDEADLVMDALQVGVGSYMWCRWVWVWVWVWVVTCGAGGCGCGCG